MALSFLCGGLGVAEAAVVHVNEVDGGTSAVYTTDETYTQKEADLKYATKMELTAKGEAIATNTANIATNQGNIKKLEDDKLSKDVAIATYATNKALNDLENAVTNKVDESVVEEALNGKANTDLSNLTEAGKSAIKNTMSADMDSKANKADVYSKTDADGKFATNDALNDLKDTVNGKADKSYVDTEVEKKANKATTLAGYGITDAYTKDEVYKKDEVYNKGEVARKLDTKANQKDLNQATDRITKNETAINGLTTKTTEISYADGEGTKISGVTIKDGNIVGNGNSAITQLANVETDKIETDSINGKSLTGTTVATATEVEAETLARKEADNKLDKKIDKEIQDRKDAIGTIAENKNYIEKDKSVSDNLVKLDAQAKKNADAIDATNKRTAGIKRDDVRNETTIENNVTVDNLCNVTAEGAVNAGSLNVTGASDLKGNVTLGTPNGANTVTVNGIADFNEAVNMDNGLTVDKGLNVTSGESNLKNTTVDGTLSVNKETTLNGKLTANDEATFTKKVTMENDLEVKGELKTDKIAMENKKTDADGTIHNSSTTITADGITHNGEVKKSGVTTESQFTHTEEGSETYAKKGDATDWTETRSDVKADGVNTEVKDSKGNRTNTSQTTEVINGYAIDKDGNSSTTSQTAKDINGNVTDKDGNKTDMKVTATKNSIQIQDKDGKNTNLQVNTMGSSVTEIKNGDGKTTKTEQTATDITNTAEQGTIKTMQ